MKISEKAFKFLIILIVIGSLTLCFLYGKGWGGELRSFNKGDYEYKPALPQPLSQLQDYLKDIYRHRGYWRGFADPVPHSGTSHWVNDYNYRIIRQEERARVRRERGYVYEYRYEYKGDHSKSGRR